MSERAAHYVPQFLLRNFRNDSGRIVVQDARTGRLRQHKPARVAFVNNLYDLDVGVPVRDHLETILGRIESATAPIIRRIVTRRSLDHLSPPDRLTLAIFIAMQLARTYKVRSYYEHICKMPDSLRMTEQGLHIQVVTGTRHPQLNHAMLMKHAQTYFAITLAGMAGVLLVAEDSPGFCISDNPVALYNTVDACKMGLAQHLRVTYPAFDDLSNIKEHLEEQLQREGAEVYMPLSPNCCLWLTETHVACAARLRTDEVIQVREQEVRCLNWLQAFSAHRLLMGRSGDFNITIDSAFSETDPEWVIRALEEHFVSANLVMRLSTERKASDYSAAEHFKVFAPKFDLE